MSEKNVLSHRLESIAKMVTPGGIVADVGCDHGFLSIYMVEQKIADRCLAMDLRSGPLSNAQKHVEKAGLSDRITCRLSDGLKRMETGEADKMVCAGMGGPLIIKILEAGFDKVKAFKELILSPQSEIPEFRIYLRDRGYEILNENMVKDEGKFYFIFKVRFSGDSVFTGTFEKSTEGSAEGNFEGCTEESTEGSAEENPERCTDGSIERKVADNFGLILPKRKDPVLKEFLDKRKENLEAIIVRLKSDGNGEKAKARIHEIKQELDIVNEALKYYA